MTAAPRYVRLAAELRGAIGRGVYPVGSYLPTEHELCARHAVSRHTAREALRVLSEEGLIARRRGAGTIVTAPPAAPAYVQPLADVDALLQYARDARLVTTAVRPLAPESRLRAALRLPREAAFTCIEGLRVVETGPPIARTRIVVADSLAPPRTVIDGLAGALTEWIAHAHGVTFDVIDQEISADLLGPKEAAALHATEGGAGLRTRRWFRLASKAAAVASDTIHPADRFVYGMSWRRRGAAPSRREADAEPS